MALWNIQKVLQKSPPPSRILAALSNPHFLSQNPSPSSIIKQQQSYQLDTNKPNEKIASFLPENLIHVKFSPFFAISPIGFCEYPNLSTGQSQDGSGDEDSGMWADSVKKKRKKKMNKHKYRKLKKRLRRQT